MNPGAETLNVTLARVQGQSWGFRLQGGSDFPIPLSIQSVVGAGLAESNGVRAGDNVLSINNQPTDALTHEQATNMIIQSGNRIDMLVQRGQVTVWRPQVTAIAPAGGHPPMHNNNDEVYIQKTSLAAKPQEFLNIGAAHNRSARPFGGGGGAPQGSVPAPVPSQPPSHQPGRGAVPYGAAPAAGDMYQNSGIPQQMNSGIPQQMNSGIPQQMNSGVPQQMNSGVPQQMNSGVPQQMHSGNGYLGNTQAPSATSSGFGQNPSENCSQSPSFRLLQGEVEGRPAGIRSVQAPVTKLNTEKKSAQHMTCKFCGTLIIGVFVKIKGEPIHPECFKCCECGMNLKNKGHFTLDDRLYCEVHIRQAASTGSAEAVPVYR